MEQEGSSTSNPDQEMRQLFLEFLAEVVKLEQLSEVGRRFLFSFQQALMFLKRPSIHKISELVQSILKQNETKRVRSYVEAGCTNSYDSVQQASLMNTSLSGLHDHLIKAQSILSELEILMDKAGNLLRARTENPSDVSELDVENSEQESKSESKEISLDTVERLDVSGCASFMAVIYSMVKQDYSMQERVVSSLGLKSLSEELDSYNLMWSLRPFVDDDVIREAINCIK